MALSAQLLLTEDIPQIVALADQSRQLLFPDVYSYTPITAQAFLEFRQTYVDSAQGACFVVKDQHRIIAMIAYHTYDLRFDLDLPISCVEVVKLFVLPEYRRQGLALKLSEALIQYAQQQGIHYLYLHTHPFLPAAEYFWQKIGFEVIQREQIGTYDTIHMLKKLD